MPPRIDLSRQAPLGTRDSSLDEGPTSEPKAQYPGTLHCVPRVRLDRTFGSGRGLREGPLSFLENSPSWRPGEYQIGIYLQEGFNAHNSKGTFPPADEPIL